jgi:hypothetical protein
MLCVVQSLDGLGILVAAPMLCKRCERWFESPQASTAVVQTQLDCDPGTVGITPKLSPFDMTVECRSNASWLYFLSTTIIPNVKEAALFAMVGV